MTAALRLEAIFAGQAVGVSTLYTGVLDEALLAYEQAHQDWPASEDWQHLEPITAFTETLHLQKVQFQPGFAVVVDAYQGIRRRNSGRR